MQRIKDLAERSKIDLTQRKECAFNIPFITMTPDGQPLDIDLKLTRDSPRSAHRATSWGGPSIPAAGYARDAEIDPKSLDHVLLVGGMTRMPDGSGRGHRVLWSAAVQAGQPRRGGSHRRRDVRVLAGG